ncbi:MAG: membrane protein insertion efficiency factor YidD [Patescibacteria group bacterium]|jgi:putative membrane protein insertion efficiency factor|nr:membrane protein insertion efficiency factor YidD [Patescibacteria group bacterium]
MKLFKYLYSFINNILSKIAIAFIKLYQKTLSLDHGPLKQMFPHGYCRFYPSCSEYAVQAIKKYGIIIGGLKAAWRILRCNPFNKGGNDPA